jgi:6-pyruvoyltetrahydropterin/6-carboxytetrahydropterin synthase
MLRVGVKKQFSAAHRLEGHPGKCARLHGHTWYVEAVFSTPEVGPDGMVLDFETARLMLDEVLGPFDHQYLNELEAFSSVRPTAENVARTVFKGLLVEAEKKAIGVHMEKVTVWESPDSWASYSSE